MFEHLCSENICRYVDDAIKKIGEALPHLNDEYWSIKAVLLEIRGEAKNIERIEDSAKKYEDEYYLSKSRERKFQQDCKSAIVDAVETLPLGGCPVQVSALYIHPMDALNPKAEMPKPHALSPTQIEGLGAWIKASVEKEFKYKPYTKAKEDLSHYTMLYYAEKKKRESLEKQVAILKGKIKMSEKRDD